MADYDELYKNYLHDDNWMTSEEAEERLRYSDCTHDDVNLTCNGELLCSNCGVAV